jgi:hypothetical protein
MATTSDFPTIDAFAADLATRTVSFSSSPLAAEFDARKLGGGTVRIRLEYAPERRFVAGQEISVSTALDHGLMQSPWTRWDETSRTLTVERSGYPTMVYDWANVSVSIGAAALGVPGVPVFAP